MAEIDGLDGLQDQVDALETSLGSATSMAAGFEAELRRVQATMGATAVDVSALEKGLSRGLRRAFDGVVLDGMKLSDALQTVAQSMINTVYSAAVRPVTDHFGGLLAQGMGNLLSGVLPFADGGSFSQGRVMPFANGGVVSGPTTFPMRGATGLMGEAGPEAIMPLARGADGKLGVRMQGQGATTVVMNITTPDVEGFRRSQSQIAAQMGRALGRGQRIR
ncbi:phage tail tape measure protein [Thalassobius vesicularis]|uniref:Phage tail tape measure protein n=1 Tax=Thalassobius vesicularis TaxID=1294297 RepID=A0A4S3MA07_9RHOB|nr:phage tail tape measure protein [Thalassobius vesicularis]THD74649.1 phage tail tape measure protein [Thalassobius vesicularis]